MAIRAQFQSSSEIGVFAKLTNSYCLVAQGGSENFYSVFESELSEHIPVVHVSISGTKVIGSMVAGNKNGVLLPTTTSDQELMHIRNSLPESVKVIRIEEKLTALGNPFFFIRFLFQNRTFFFFLCLFFKNCSRPPFLLAVSQRSKIRNQNNPSFLQVFVQLFQ
ncbi:hypothetical protein M0813_26006 [Anaeramoeba flamelloides]|uniref:Eukaryotic translation initiation factor 6 n=1 Tax=Anaeramoeba flamelloides TaxID=1746091 RepID=A0ABQ8Y2G5_9EUKA|nr:hypothetical protein M0813_26006 [Anaeramoeba flamelloides]